jgi:hypothetical protein
MLYLCRCNEFEGSFVADATILKVFKDKTDLPLQAGITVPISSSLFGNLCGYDLAIGEKYILFTDANGLPLQVVSGGTTGSNVTKSTTTYTSTSTSGDGATASATANGATSGTSSSSSSSSSRRLLSRGYRTPKVSASPPPLLPPPTTTTTTVTSTNRTKVTSPVRCQQNRR